MSCFYSEILVAPSGLVGSLEEGTTRVHHRPVQAAAPQYHFYGATIHNHIPRQAWLQRTRVEPGNVCSWYAQQIGATALLLFHFVSQTRCKQRMARCKQRMGGFTILIGQHDPITGPFIAHGKGFLFNVLRVLCHQ